MINVFKSPDIQGLKKDIALYGSIMPSYIKAQIVIAIAEQEEKDEKNEQEEKTDSYHDIDVCVSYGHVDDNNKIANEGVLIFFAISRPTPLHLIIVAQLIIQTAKEVRLR